jgi:nucleotide-binding universal stress UspA family protein
VSAEEVSRDELVEEYGPAWEPGPYEAGTDGPRTILVGIDGSRTSLRAGAYAGGLARRQGARLVVLYVASMSSWSGMVPAAVAVQEQTFNESIDELREQIRSRVHEAEIPITFVIRRGDPLAEIQRAATDYRADMVVVGSSEQAGHRLIGSIAARLVKAGRWPVTVVP